MHCVNILVGMSRCFPEGAGALFLVLSYYWCCHCSFWLRLYCVFPFSLSLCFLSSFQSFVLELCLRYFIFSAVFLIFSSFLFSFFLFLIYSSFFIFTLIFLGYYYFSYKLLVALFLFTFLKISRFVISVLEARCFSYLYFSYGLFHFLRVCFFINFFQRLLHRRKWLGVVASDPVTWEFTFFFFHLFIKFSVIFFFVLLFFAFLSLSLFFFFFFS